MDFSQVKDATDFVLIPEGTVVEAMIGEVKALPGKEDPSKTVLHIDLQVSKGEYIFAKIKEVIVIAGGDAEMLERNKSKVKRMLEYGKDASATNPDGYVISEFTNSKGRSETKWSELSGMIIGFQTKLESFVSNKDGKKLYSTKVGAYASKNKESGGYKFFNAIQEGTQPWQKPLPTDSASKNKSEPAGMPDYSIPVDAYEDSY
jgi:hypothetical protein